MQDIIIDARNLEKRFTVRRHRSGMLGSLRGLVDRSGSQVTAVKGISLTIQRGEIVGYIGPNGAGKSTMIKMLTGILVPSAGDASVAGLVPWEQRKQLAQRIGVVFGQRTQLWWDLALVDSLELLRHMYRIPEQRFRANLDQARELLDLDEFLHTPVRQLSLGQRMRGDLAAALLHDPEILYLDEPTIGLDIVAKARIRAFLATLNREQRVTILLTTHDLADIEHLCRRIVVIDHGQVMYDGDLASLRSGFGSRRQIIVDFDTAPDGRLTGIADDSIELRRQDGPRVHLAFDGQALSATDVLARAATYGTIRDVSIEEPRIEEIIRQMYEGRLVPGG